MRDGALLVLSAIALLAGCLEDAPALIEVSVAIENHGDAPIAYVVDLEGGRAPHHAAGTVAAGETWVQAFFANGDAVTLTVEADGVRANQTYRPDTACGGGRLDAAWDGAWTFTTGHGDC